MMAKKRGIGAIDESLEVAREEELSEGETFQLVTLLLAGDEFGFHIDKVQEIIRYSAMRITAIPNSPPFVEGVINLRGRLVPVVDLRRRFGFDEEDLDQTSRIMIVAVGGRTLGLIVDAVVEVVRVASIEVEKLPDLAAGVGTEFVEGVCRVSRGMVVVLDLDAMFSAEETDAMGSLSE